MPIFKKDIKQSGAPISFPKMNEVQVLVGPCTAMALTENKIPLDGRHYVCAGEIHSNNGLKLRASFTINTHHFDYLDRETVRIHLDDGYYRIEEDELFEKLSVLKSDFFPYRWKLDIPLETEGKGPFTANPNL